MENGKRKNKDNFKKPAQPRICLGDQASQIESDGPNQNPMMKSGSD